MPFEAADHPVTDSAQRHPGDGDTDGVRQIEGRYRPVQNGPYRRAGGEPDGGAPGRGTEGAADDRAGRHLRPAESLDRSFEREPGGGADQQAVAGTAGGARHRVLIDATQVNAAQRRHCAPEGAAHTNAGDPGKRLGTRYRAAQRPQHRPRVEAQGAAG